MATDLLDGRVAIVTGGAGNLGAPSAGCSRSRVRAVVINDINADAGARWPTR